MKVNELKAEMDTRFEKVDARFDAVDARFAAVDARFDAVDARLDAVDARISASEANLRRHFDVVTEQLRGDISLIASGLVNVNTMLEREIADSRSIRATLVSIVNNHDLRLVALEQIKE